MLWRDYASLLNPSRVLVYVVEGLHVIAEPFQSSSLCCGGTTVIAEPFQSFSLCCGGTMYHRSRVLFHVVEGLRIIAEPFRSFS